MFRSLDICRISLKSSRRRFQATLVGIVFAWPTMVSTAVGCEKCAAAAQCDQCGGYVEEGCTSCGPRDRSLTLPRLSTRLLDSLDSAADRFEAAMLPRRPLLGQRCSCDHGCSEMVACDADSMLQGDVIFAASPADAHSLGISTDNLQSSTVTENLHAAEEQLTITPEVAPESHQVEELHPVKLPSESQPTQPSLDVPSITPSEDYLHDPFEDDARNQAPGKARPLNRYALNADTHDKASQHTEVNRYKSGNVAPQGSVAPAIAVASYLQTQSSGQQGLNKAPVRRSIKDEVTVAPTKSPSTRRAPNKQESHGVVQAAATLDLAR